MVLQVPASQFAHWRDSVSTPGNTPGDSPAMPLLLDVREPWELQTACVREDGFELLRIPMREVPARLAELDPARPTAILCHHGMRSQQVANYLAQSGFTDVVNLQGGIDAWSQDIDPTVPCY